MERSRPSAGAARNSAAPCLSETSMGVIDDTFLKYYQILTALRRGSLGSSFSGGLGLSRRQVRFQFVLSNLALANRNLPAIIWCFVSRTRLASE